MNAFEKRRHELTLERGKAVSQSDIADKLGVYSSTVSAWESGKSAPAVAKCKPMAKVYAVSEETMQAWIYKAHADVAKRKRQEKARPAAEGVKA